MKELLEQLFTGKILSATQAKAALKGIVTEEYSPEVVASFLTVFRMRDVTANELEGFCQAMLSLCKSMDLSEFDPIDMCGTGGDGKDTFNISTLSAFVVAGAGVHVAKHGNYGVSSNCGSSHVLEELGVRFTDSDTVIKRQIEEAKICYLHAPLFHRAMKSVAPIRKALGIRTVFNLLGPLSNPALVKRQLVGVFSLEVAELYSTVLRRSAESFTVVYSADGYDECSLTADTKCSSSFGQELLAPEDFGLSRLSPEMIAGGATVADGAEVFMNVLTGNGTGAQRDVVCANAALGIRVRYPETPIHECFQLARDSLNSKKALGAFEKLRELSQ